MTFVQVDDPWSPDSEHVLRKDGTGSAPDKGKDSAQQGEELRAESHSPLTQSVEQKLASAENSSFLSHEVELDADLDGGGNQPGETRQNISFEPSPGWNKPTRNLTADTPASVGFSAQRAERSGRKADPKVILSHMLRHFKEGPGQW